MKKDEQFYKNGSSFFMKIKELYVTGSGILWQLRCVAFRSSAYHWAASVSISIYSLTFRNLSRFNAIDACFSRQNKNKNNAIAARFSGRDKNINEMALATFNY